MARVSTYLNFVRNTEEAFNFYKSVFGGEFTGGIMRLGETPSSAGGPALPEEDKNLIMHIELPIMGCHVLMGTDAPESMGFHLTKGDNVHICIEPDTKEETKALFDKLSAGGKITMDLQDTFWGAYYGSFTDKFGVNWMLNLTKKPKITVQTIVKAGIDKVWKFWTTPNHIMQWNNASVDWHTPKAENDLRTGGKFNFRMEAKDGSFGFDFGGVYDLVKMNEKIDYTIGDGRKVTVTFTTKGSETVVEEIFEAEGENSIEMQRQGWQAILDNFKKYTESAG